MTASWQAVASEGTDPLRLRDLVAALVLRGTAVRATVRESVRDGGDLVEAVAAVGDEPVLDADVVEPMAAAWSAHDVEVAVVGDPGDVITRRRPGWDERAWLVATRGRPHPDGPCVAIVGARRATPYGQGIAAWLASSCGEAGVRVVSGGAVGIDAAAHDAAAPTEGGTTVVLGCGHDVPYPRPHTGPGALFARVLDGGGSILSESLPGAQPTPHRVRARNRLVAALADVVVVVEGGPRSGALITATAAAELGVPVLAVPGDVRAPGSAAPHQLLADGAAVCRQPADVLALLDVAARRPDDDVGAGAGLPHVGGLPSSAVRLLVDRWPRPVSVDDLAGAAGTTAGALLGAVTRARIEGALAVGPTGVRLTRGPR